MGYLRPILFHWNTILAGEIVLWLSAGAMIVLWLSEVITEYGLGNGTSIFVYVNIVSNLPNIFRKIIEERNENPIVLSGLSTIVLSILILLALYSIALLQNSTFRINLISAKRLNRTSTPYDDYGIDQSSYLPLRFNQAGVMPIILTTSFLVIPNYLINLKIFSRLDFLTNYKWIYWIGYILLIFGGVVLDIKREISNIYYSEVYKSRY